VIWHDSTVRGVHLPVEPAILSQKWPVGGQLGWPERGWFWTCLVVGFEKLRLSEAGHHHKAFWFWHHQCCWCALVSLKADAQLVYEWLQITSFISETMEVFARLAVTSKPSSQPMWLNV